MKKTLTTLLSLIFTLSLCAQLPKKTVIATYDSTANDKAYFRTEKDNKAVLFVEDGYDQNRRQKGTTEFYNPSAVKTYTINGLEWQNHTNTNNAGKKYEVEYTAQQITGEDGSFIINIIVSSEKYDSAYIAFKKEYNAWQLNNDKQTKLNVAPNSPKAVASQYLEACKVGDVNKAKAQMASEGYVTSLQKKNEVTGKTIKFYQLQASDGAQFKGEFTKLYNKLLETGEKQPVADLVDYFTPTRAMVGYLMGNNYMYCYVLDKSSGAWKIIDYDDHLLIPMMGQELALRKKMIFKKTGQRKLW